MKKILCLIVCIAIMLCLVSCNSLSNNSVNSEYELTEITLQGKNGSNADDYKVAFKPAKEMDKVKAYMVIYSTQLKEEVEAFLSELDYEELKALDEEESKAYFIEDLTYADGIGNTLDMDQRDIVTGKPFGATGEYRFYAATVSEEGLLALGEADRTELIEGFADEVIITIDGSEVRGNYVSENKNISTLVFYSQLSYNEMEKHCARIKYETIKDGKSVVEGNDNTFTFDYKALKDFDNNFYDSTKMYYVYVASYKDGEYLGMSYDVANFILPKDVPSPTGIIGDGKGVVFPNGGASSISGDRSSIISKNQSLFDGIKGTPRIAIIGASSGSEATISSHFYIDDSTDSYLTRFAEAGFEAVYIPLTIENKEVVGQSDYFARLLESCHGVYFTGGNQEDAIISMTDDNGSYNEIGKAVINLHSRGGILMGSSAGAHILGNVCHQDSDSVSAIKGIKSSKIYNGLPSAKSSVGDDIIFESHFNARGRLGRLIKTMSEKGVTFGAGLDEGTGIAIQDNIGTVYGTGQVYLVDTSEATINSEGDFQAKDVIVHILSQGDKYDFNKKEVIFAEKNTGDKLPSTESILGDFFGENYMTSISFIDLLTSKSNSKTYYHDNIKVTLTKTNKTKLKVSEKESYTRINALSKTPKFTTSNIIVDIEIE